MKKGLRGVNSASKPSGDGCVECLASPKGWWLHLRRCAEYGHIGSCDSSPSQHASEHAAATGHPIIASFEPGEDWFFDYDKQGMIKGVELLPPHAHPANQPAPGPAGRVPANWESLLNYCPLWGLAGYGAWKGSLEPGSELLDSTSVRLLPRPRDTSAVIGSAELATYKAGVCDDVA